MGAGGIHRMRSWAPPVFVAILAVLVRVPFFDWPLISDEGGYAYTAYWWLHGLTLYSGDLWLDRPQGIFVAYMVPVLLGGSTWVIRQQTPLYVVALDMPLTALDPDGRFRQALDAGYFVEANFDAIPLYRRR